MDELRELVESAHAERLVEPLWPPTPEERSERWSEFLRWVPTERGRRLDRPRSLSPADLALGAKELLEPTRAALFSWLSIVLLLAAPVLSKEQLLGEEEIAGYEVNFVTVVLLAFPLLAVARGTWGEYNLRKAAQSWPRFHRPDPFIGEIQSWYLERGWWPMLGPLAAALLEVGLFGGLYGWSGWLWPIAIAVTVGGLAFPRWRRFVKEIRRRQRYEIPVGM